jgi:hypothetical protein
MTLRRLAIVFLLVVVLPFHETASSAQRGGGSGLIIAVEGEVRVARAGRRKPAVEGFVVEPGDTISVKTGGMCSGFGLDGSPFHITGPAELVLKALSRDGTLDKVRGFVTRQLAQWSGTSRSRSLVSRAVRDWERVVQSPATLIPGPDGAVRASEPRFFWTTIPGVDSYVVTIAPADGDEIKQTVRGHSMVAQDLEPGESYVWKVEAQRDGTHAAPNWSAFRVMTPDEEKQLKEASSELSDLEAGVLLFSVGLHDEAVYRFDAAVNAGSQRRSALRWRSQVLAAIGLDKDAYEDLVQTIEW